MHHSPTSPGTSPMISHRSLAFWGTSALAVFWAYALIRPALLWDWEYYHDTPLLNFAAVMMHDFGMVPYRDMFETTMPGTFLFHYIIVGLGLETQTAFVTLGLLAMFALAGAGTLILSRVHYWSALMFAPFFLMVILQFGATALFQREILGLLAICSALILATRAGPRRQYLLRQGAVGLFFGIAATIKPQFGLGAPVGVLCLAALTWDADDTRPFVSVVIRGILASVAGFALPLIAAFLWIWSYGALDRFLFILTEYTPLYIQQTQSHAFTSPERRTQYLWQLWIKFAGFWTLLPGALMLSLLILGYRKLIARRMLILLSTITGLVAVYGVVPVLSGQFWDYHYYPFIYFAIMAASALLGLAMGPYFSQSGKRACFAIVALTIGLNLSPVNNLEWRRDDARIRVALAKDMETALRKWVPEGGRVQPIDWTAGALHAMMRARIPIATRFFYDFHFAHHASSDVNAGLRAEFMNALMDAPPEVILVAHTRMKVHGLDVSYDFPQLDAFTDTYYRPVGQNAQFDILLRRDLAS